MSLRTWLKTIYQNDSECQVDIINGRERWLNPGNFLLHFLYKHRIKQQCIAQGTAASSLLLMRSNREACVRIPFKCQHLTNNLQEEFCFEKRIYFVTWGCVSCIAHSMQITEITKTCLHQTFIQLWDTLLIYSENFTPRL